jgi:hypothetical protein
MLVTEERLQYNSVFKHALFHMAHHQLSNIAYTIWVKANKREVESHETWSLLWPCDTHYTTDGCSIMLQLSNKWTNACKPYPLPE